MELNDNEFDATFRKKVFDADPQFEEAAWDKMERKLKRRDRIVFFRKSALVLLALLAGVWGYYSFERTPDKRIDQVSNKKPFDKTVSADKTEPLDKTIPETGRTRDAATASNDAKYPAGEHKKEGTVRGVVVPRPVRLEADMDAAKSEQLLSSGAFSSVVPDQVALNGIVTTDMEERMKPVVIKDLSPVLNQGLPGKKTIKVKRSLPVSLAISAGPEFNSASSVVGGDPGFNAGLTLGFGISKRLDLQTGVRYSVKKYSGAGGIRYNFPNTNATWLKNNLTGLDATCNVLEIPLTASFKVADNARRSINLNAGISSYLMLKEDYVFKYDNQYGAETERTLQKNNANQHILSVVDLSATYFIKLKDNNLKIGLEPFMKIPLSGVGEGNINLKSSGISLKLRYDLDKKNN
jgi:hypothetical protein